MITGLWVKVCGGQGTRVREYPYSPQKLRQDNPETMFRSEMDEETLARWRVLPVTPTERPAYHPAKIIVEDKPKWIDGTWFQVWKQIDAEQPTAAQLIEFARDCRRNKEARGIVVGGVPIDTDERSQTKILGARVAADANPNWQTIWSGSDGGSYPLNSLVMILISNAVQEHVSQCFVDYAAVVKLINEGEFTRYAQVEAVFA